MMKRKRTIFTPVALLVGTFLLFGAAGTRAGEQEESPPREHPGMMGGPPDMGAEMMAMHQKMQAQMQSMDERLDALVADMEAAEGDAKVDAIAAVVSELVGQRKAMHGMMMEMRPRMMHHMMQQGAPGMMHGMGHGRMHSTGDCPMMEDCPMGEDCPMKEDCPMMRHDPSGEQPGAADDPTEPRSEG